MLGDPCISRLPVIQIAFNDKYITANQQRPISVSCVLT